MSKKRINAIVFTLTKKSSKIIILTPLKQLLRTRVSLLDLH